MVKLQRQLIFHALKILKIGGELIFSVCSYEPDETYDQLSWIKNHFKDNIEIVNPTTRMPGYYKRFVTRSLTLLIISGNKDAMDGFGAFIIKKKADLATN